MNSVPASSTARRLVYALKPRSPGIIAVASIRPLPKHRLQGGGYILRPGWSGCLTSGNPVPPHSGHSTFDFDAPATLRKWPSIKSERANTADHPYLIVDGTLDDCIRQFVSKPISQHHLYEIHTAPQGELVSAVLLARHIVEI